MYLFTFEPYEWNYCGGAIVVIAQNYEEAVALIIKEATERRKVDPDSAPTYEKSHFSHTKDVFKKDSWDQWLLTNTILIADNEKPRIVLDNWNYLVLDNWNYA